MSSARVSLCSQKTMHTKLIGVQVVLILAYSTIILFGVTGNSLVIYVVYRFKNLRNVTNFFIVNLAVADLLVNMLCLPFTLVYTLYGEWMFGQVLCFLLPCAQCMAVHVSTITMNVIALDRYRSIVYHMETKMSKEMCALVIVITWAVSALLASPVTWHINISIRYHTGHKLCAAWSRSTACLTHPPGEPPFPSSNLPHSIYDHLTPVSKLRLFQKFMGRA
uniref:G-protein coupled receptors family 1 profile domain-containing protein n=1 Tax=Mola mola TaxID=94237 RepID=A0A3Q3VRJ8_MOLML